MSTLTDEQIDAIRARAAEDARPWTFNAKNGWVEAVNPAPNGQGETTYNWVAGGIDQLYGAWIVANHNDIPALLATIDALTEQVYQLGVGRSQAELRWRDCEATLAEAHKLNRRLLDDLADALGLDATAWDVAHVGPDMAHDTILAAVHGLMAVARAALLAFEGRVAGEAYIAAGYAAMSAMRALPASVRAELERETTT